MLKRPGLTLFAVYILVVGSSGLVHLLDTDFAGKWTRGNISKYIDKGEKLYAAKACAGCHGEAGKNPQAENYPVLAFQNALYLEEQTKMIRDGQRTGGMSSLMKNAVKGLTDSEAKLISIYLANQ